MECKFCSTENSDNAVYCKNCGKRLDGKIVCPSCGKTTDAGAYCEMCGARIDGKVVCECGAIVEGNYCLQCGRPSPKIKFKPATAKQRAAAYAAVDGDFVAPWQKALKIVSASAAMLGVLMAFIFVFLIGVKADLKGKAPSEISALFDLNLSEKIWYYFGDAYSEIQDSLLSMTAYSGQYATSLYISAVFGTIIASLTLIGVCVGAVITTVSFVKHFTEKKEFNFKAAVFTVGTYLAGSMAMLALEYVKVAIKGYTPSGSATTINCKFGTVFDGATAFGVWFSVACILAAYLCAVASDGKKNFSAEVIVKRASVLLGTAFAVVAVVCTAKAAVTFTLREGINSFKMNISADKLGVIAAAAIDPSSTADTFERQMQLYRSGLISVIISSLAFIVAPFVISRLFAINEGGGVASIILSVFLAVTVLTVMICHIYDVSVFKNVAMETDMQVGGSGSSSSLSYEGMKFGVSGVIPALVFSLLTVAISIVGYAVKKK